MTTLALTLKHMPDGWAVYLTNGRQVVRYRGLGARWRALRYLARMS